MVNFEFQISYYYIWIRFQVCFLQNNSYIWNFVNLLNFAIFYLLVYLKKIKMHAEIKINWIYIFQQNMTLNMPIITISIPLQAGTPTL